jgi:hypothetical protein
VCIASPTGREADDPRIEDKGDEHHRRQIKSPLETEISRMMRGYPPAAVLRDRYGAR